MRKYSGITPGSEIYEIYKRIHLYHWLFIFKQDGDVNASEL